MAPKWDVHSYHYSVGAGDAAIHLLVDASLSPPKVKGAVLLDGGRAVGFPILKEGIRRLSSQYNCGTDKTGKPLPLQFNSIVISHWDDDHYGGIVKLLRSDFQANAGCGTPTKDLRSSYCIYDVSREPMTTLYAPYWLQASSSTRKPAKQKAYERPGQWTQYQDAATKQQYVNMCIGKIANGKDWVHKVAKLCAETGYGSGDIQVGMLGRNFFYNGGDGMQLRSEKDPAQITDVATLINEMTLPNQPGLFCIGADSMLVGTGNVQAKLPPGGVDEPGVIDGGTDTAVNRSSIICIIVRSDGSVLHYFGGDVAYESELLLPKWLKNNGGKLNTERIPVMKLGHHGAATSSPVELLDLLMPHYVFVSSGAQYGHPSKFCPVVQTKTCLTGSVLLGYEVLMYQAALWNFCGQGQGWAIFGRQLLGTTYPTWFRDHTAFSVDAMTQGSQFETWRSEVVNTSKQGSSPLQTFNFENDTWKTAIKTGGVVLKHQIADSVEQWWIAGPGVLTPNTMMPMGWASHIVPKGGKNRYQFQAASAELLARHFHFPAVPTTVPFTHDTIKFGGSAPFSESLQLCKLDLVGYRPPRPPRQFPSSGVVSGNTRLAKVARASVAAVTSASTLANVTTGKKRKADPEDDADSGSNSDSGATAKKTRPEPAVTPFVQNTSVPHADPGDTSYWFVSSVWDPARIIAGRTTVAPAGSDLDNFLCCLAPAALGVVSPPPPGAPPKTPVAVLPNEQWYYWLTLFQNIAPCISAHVLTDAAANLQGFAIDLNVQVSGTNYVLGFSTEATVSELSPAAPTSASLSPEGVLVGTATIALGLSDASCFPPTIQLSQICSLVQFRSYKDNTADASPLLKSAGPQPTPPSFTPYDWGVPFFGLADTVSLTLETQPDGAGQGPRNCLWFSSADAYLTSLRLQFKIDESDSPVLSWLEDHVLAKGVVSLASQPQIIARKQGRPAGGLVDLQEQTGSLQYGLESHVMLNLQLAVNNTAASSASAADPFRFELFFTFGRADVEMIFLNQSANYDVGEMLKTLGSCIPGLASDSLSNLADLLPHWFTDVGKVIVREVRLVAANDVTDPSRLKSASVEFEVPFSIHGQATAFHLSFSWPDKTFVASLFVAPSPVTTVDGDPWKSPTLDVRCLPEYEEYMYRPSSDPDLTTTGIPLAGLVPGRPADKAIAPAPGGIDLEVKQLSIQIRPDPTLSVAFRASIASGRPQGQEVAVPPIQVDAVDLMASYDGSELQLILQIQLEVTAPPTASDDALPVLLLGQFEYDDRDDSARAVDVAAGSSSRWSFTGVIENMPLSYLWDFLDPHAQGLLVDILHAIDVDSLQVSYSYSSAGSNCDAKSFSFDGLIYIDMLALQLSYVWDDTGWEFRGTVGASDKVSSLKGILKTFCPADIVDLVPDCCDIQLGQLQEQELNGLVFDEPGPRLSSGRLTPSSLKGSPVDVDQLLIIHRPTATKPYVLFILTVSLAGGRSLTFIQLRYPGKNADDKQITKRIVRFTLEALPDMGAVVPTVNSFAQPFDDMEFVWVHDDSGTGLQRGDVNIFNQRDVLLEDYWVPYKDTFKQPGTTDILLTLGCHFLLNKDAVAILDYGFGAPASSSPQRPTDPAPASPVSDSNNPTPTMAPLQVTMGPITIANIGVQFSKDSSSRDVISFHFDATLQVGPIGFGVLGLHIDLTFDAGITVENLLRLEGITPGAHIDGLAADFDSPPLTVAGLLEKSDDIYKGGVVVSLEPYSFLAVGSYGEMEEESDGSVYPVGLAPAGKTKVATFKSFFIFGELEGPIVDLGFLEVLGVKLGFGYNALLRNPTLDELSSFPMMQNPFSASGSESAANANPMTLLSSFYNVTPSPWITPQNDVLWFAVGLTIVAFELMSVTAVIVVDLEPSVILNIFADAVATMPGNGTPSEANFVYAEIQIVASVDFSRGTMMADGKLAPNSFIMDPKCHLSGGFGMRYWFGGSNPYSGDWVYTVGGYHPAYTPAPQYPNPARLAIAWQVNWSLTVTGDAYFAITPKAAMGGGALLAVYSAGPLGAHFDAYADFLINFHPFHYIGDVGVDVGVSFTMDLLFVTLHISCDAGADVHLEGPGFGGVARVHFWLFEFDVPFGDTPSAPGALPWGDFWNLLTQEGKDPASVSRGDGHGSSGGASTTGGPNTAFIYNPVAGSIATDATMHTPPQGTALPPPSSALAGSKGPTFKSSTTAPRPWNVRAGTFRFRIESKMPMTHYVVNAPVGNKPVAVPHADFFIKPMHVCEPVQSSVVAVTITMMTPGGPSEVLKDQFRVTVMEKKAPASIWSQCKSFRSYA